MSQQRITLDSPSFTGVTLKQPARPSRYARDMSGYRTRSITTPPKPSSREVAAQRVIRRNEVRLDWRTQPKVFSDKATATQPGTSTATSATVSSQDRTNALSSPIATYDFTQDVENNGEALHLDLPPARASKYVKTRPVDGDKGFFRFRGKQRLQPALLYTMAGVLFLLGLGVAVMGLQANSHVAAQVKTLQKAAAGASGQSTTNGVVPPSIEKPSSKAVSSYVVAPDMPRYISIPKLNVFSRLFPMGVNSKSQLEAPKNIHDAGWYTDSSKPGLPGAMLIDGHSGIGRTNGVFHNVAQLSRGDKIVIERGDGQSFLYTVVSVEVLKVDAVDMTTMVTPAEKANEGLNLITCTGRQIPGTTSLDQRVLVRAVRA